ncbi:unnamed protein product [Pedinophyceae sp. YPF-701]|nr:unnamed protein product [Pedinophyceae sp. YPF-701]
MSAPPRAAHGKGSSERGAKGPPGLLGIFCGCFGAQPASGHKEAPSSAKSASKARQEQLDSHRGRSRRALTAEFEPAGSTLHTGPRSRESSTGRYPESVRASSVRRERPQGSQRVLTSTSRGRAEFADRPAGARSHVDAAHSMHDRRRRRSSAERYPSAHASRDAQYGRSGAPSRASRARPSKGRSAIELASDAQLRTYTLRQSRSSRRSEAFDARLEGLGGLSLRDLAARRSASRPRASVTRNALTPQRSQRGSVNASSPARSRRSLVSRQGETSSRRSLLSRQDLAADYGPMAHSERRAPAVRPGRANTAPARDLRRYVDEADESARARSNRRGASERSLRAFHGLVDRGMDDVPRAALPKRTPSNQRARQLSSYQLRDEPQVTPEQPSRAAHPQASDSALTLQMVDWEGEFRDSLEDQRESATRNNTPASLEHVLRASPSGELANSPAGAALPPKARRAHSNVQRASSAGLALSLLNPMSAISEGIELSPSAQ